MKIKIIDRKGKEILKGKYLYLERGCDNHNVQNFFMVINNEKIGDFKIDFTGSKENMEKLREKLGGEFKEKK